MRKIVEIMLASLAKKVVKKYRPKIIGITGSVGKTSTKEAVVAVLQKDFHLRSNIKNYNNELGVPLTILGVESPRRSILGWIKVLFIAFRLLLVFDEKYPKVLVLEMGADNPGDLEYLTKIAPCDIGIVTKVAPAHLEQFGSIDNIAKEKSVVVNHLKKEGIAVLNYDDKRVRLMADFVEAKTVSYGFEDGATIRALELDEVAKNESSLGISFKVVFGQATVPFFLDGVVGKPGIYASLAGIAVGLSMGMNILQISEKLKNYRNPKGRLNLLAGKKDIFLIDDSYNASPEAVLVALETLADFKAKGFNRRVAVLGDMLELGDYEREAHIKIGKRVADLGIDYFFAVGKNRDFLKEGALLGGFSESKIFLAEKVEELKEVIMDYLNNRDVVLVKGSQGARMEKISKAILLEEDKAKDFLVRQENGWTD